MDLFYTLFNRSSQEKQMPIRDKFRNRRYFSKQLCRNLRLSAVTENSIAEAKNEDERPFLYWSSSLDRMLRLNIMYSMGEGMEELQTLYLQSFDYFLLGFDLKSPVYADILGRISLGVLLNIPGEKFTQLVDYVKRMDSQARSADWKPDALLWFILNSRAKEEERQPYAENLSFPKTYKGLYKVTGIKDRMQAGEMLTEYLGKWYALNKHAPWYNTHLRDNGYTGYWAWEIAAIARIMQLDDSHLKGNPYYPYDMVHWNAE